MKKMLMLVLILFTLPAYAQQHGWVRVAQVGDQFTNLQAVEFTDSLHGWLYGSRVNYMYTLDGGITWNQAISAGFAATSISMVDSLTGWVAGNGFNEGGIGKTTNAGRSWVQQRLRYDQAYYGTASLSVTKNITVGFAHPDTGKIVETLNGGNIWTERSTPDSIGIPFRVRFVDSLYGWILAGADKLLRTKDGGNTWLLSARPRGLVAISFIDTLHGWGIHGQNPQVYRTTNGGTTWQPQYCICSFEDAFGPRTISFVDSLNGWVFGGTFYQGDLAGAIYRTTNGGVTFYREHVGGTRGFNDGQMLDRFHGWAVGDNGSVFSYRPVTRVSEKIAERPTKLTLRPNYPNPFNSATRIEYEIVERSLVWLSVFDVSGKEVSKLVNAEHEPGVYRIVFDARLLSSGTYYCKLTSGRKSSTIKLNLIK
jgi:photosystem II stability/assembly factor-like uncharacterized protein